jgi:hypothetical protein
MANQDRGEQAIRNGNNYEYVAGGQRLKDQTKQWKTIQDAKKSGPKGKAVDLNALFDAIESHEKG